MLRLRVFESDGEVRVWLVDERGSALRQLHDPIGGLPGKIDWERTVESCRQMGEEGLEINFAFEEG